MAIKVKLPAIDTGFEAGTIIAWMKSVGEAVSEGDVLVEIEGSKATFEVKAEASGVLGKCIYEEGTEDIPVGTVIAILLEEGETIEDFDRGGEEEQATVEKERKTEAHLEKKSEAEKEKTPVSPAAKRLAAKLGVSLNEIDGRGPNGRILKEDVLEAASSVKTITHNELPREKTSSVTQIPINSMRKTIAHRLTEAKQKIPHFYMSEDCCVDELIALRAKLNDKFSNDKKDRRLTLTDFIVKACGLALADVPEANVQWAETNMLQLNSTDIAVAIATSTGLITPVVRDVVNKTIFQVSQELRELMIRTKEGRLNPSDYQGGSLTVSNLGMYGISQFYAIINPPQACIVAVGKSEQRIVVRENVPSVATMMTCTLSVDHRCVDGVVAAALISSLKEYLENPGLLVFDKKESFFA